MNNISPAIVIEPYHPDWPTKFQIEAEVIRQAISHYITAIEHIGSTSVPGLAAKPIIDMLIGVKSLQDTPDFVPPLINSGYLYKPEFEIDLPERRYLYKVHDGQDIVHLHMVEPGSEFFRRHIAFRDYLRSHPESAAEYAALKIKLAKVYGSDREGYTDAKTTFIKEIEAKALSG